MPVCQVSKLTSILKEEKKKEVCGEFYQILKSLLSIKCEQLALLEFNNGQRVNGRTGPWAGLAASKQAVIASKNGGIDVTKTPIVYWYRVRVVYSRTRY